MRYLQSMEVESVSLLSAGKQQSVVGVGHCNTLREEYLDSKRELVLPFQGLSAALMRVESDHQTFRAEIQTICVDLQRALQRWS